MNLFANLLLDLVLFSIFFALNALSASTDDSEKCNIFSSVKRTFLKEGFHREIDYLIEVTHFESWENCVLCIEQVISKSFYINTDELAELNRLGKILGAVNDTVDVELPSKLAKAHSLYIYTELLELNNRLAARVSLPIHARYQSAQVGGGTVRAFLEPPSVFLHCPRLRCQGFNNILTCPGSPLEQCLYKKLPNLDLSKVYVDVPVGNLDHYSLVGGFTFGQTSTPSFGQTSAPSFGQTSTPSFGQTPAPTFGQTSAPTFGQTSAPTFGQTPAPTFGQTSAPAFGQTSAPTFGQTSAPSFGFGTPTTSATAAPSGGLTFGQTPASGFSLGGTTPATTQSGFSFGSTATTTTQPTLSFGTPTTSATGFGLATSTPQTGFSFGSTPASTGLTFNAPATQTPGFFQATSAPSLFSTAKPTFGLTSTTTLTPTTGGLFGSKPAAPSLGGNLGGESALQCLTRSDKDNPIPPELMQLVENFKTVVKQQKNSSSEIARSNDKPFRKIADDIESVKHLLLRVERAVNQNKNMINKLKIDAARCVADCEMAQRTLEVQPGFQVDNTAPLDYFTQLVERFQEQVVTLRVEIENTERHVQSALNSAAVTPEELNQLVRRLHECFIALASRLQLLHTNISCLKQTHLGIRRKKTNDNTDIYDRRQAALKEKTEIVTSTSALTVNNLYSSMAAMVQARVAEAPAAAGSTMPAPSLSLFSTTAPMTPAPTFGSVQLKSPPGTKRGKR